MARFQAQTSAALDEELESLRERLGLRDNQKAELLREVAALAAWVVRQSEEGRKIEARRGRTVETLRRPTLERLRQKSEEPSVSRIALTDAEVVRLAEILDRGFTPTPDLLKALSNLADPRRRPPKLRWKDKAA